MSHLTAAGKAMLPKSVSLKFDHVRIGLAPADDVTIELMQKGVVIWSITKPKLLPGDFIVCGTLRGFLDLNLEGPK